MSNLKKLYYNMEKLSDDWNTMPETQKASDEFEKAVGSEFYEKYEEEISAYMCANEKQGFIKGFQYAISLLMDGRKLQEV